MLLLSPGACQGHVFLAFTQSSCSKQSLEGWKSRQRGLWRLSCGESGCLHTCSFLVDLAHSGGIGCSGNTIRGNSGASGRDGSTWCLGPLNLLSGLSWGS